MKLEPGMLIFDPWMFDDEGEFGMLLSVEGRVQWFRRNIIEYEAMTMILMFAEECEKLKKELDRTR